MLQVLARGAPYPMLVLPETGGYWQDGSEAPEDPPAQGLPQCGSNNKFKLEVDDTAKCYRHHFLGKVCLVFF